MTGKDQRSRWWPGMYFYCFFSPNRWRIHLMKKLHNWLPSVQFSGLKDQLFLIITLGKLVKASCSVSDYIVCLCRQSYYMIDRLIKTIQYTYDDHIIQTTDTMRVTKSACSYDSLVSLQHALNTSGKLYRMEIR